MTTEEITDANRKAACDAVKVLDGPANTARKLTELLQADYSDAKTVRIGSVWSWMHRDRSGIPIAFILYMEKLSGIPREKLRPDIPWREN